MLVKQFQNQLWHMTKPDAAVIQEGQVARTWCRKRVVVRFQLNAGAPMGTVCQACKTRRAALLKDV